MSEAIIARRSGKGSAEAEYQYKVEYITGSTPWVAPTDILNNTVSVRLFGGGGGGGGSKDGSVSTSGGGGGWMNNADIEIIPGETIQITIGAGGSIRSSGGSTSFGTYLSAAGGEGANYVRAGNGGSGGGALSYWYTSGGSTFYMYGGTGYQFGGGAGYAGGGKGGTWGGGGGTWSNHTAGDGGTYGGGGGADFDTDYVDTGMSGYWEYYYGNSGNGGTYGGGGGGYNATIKGIGGVYGGNGGSGTNGNNGTNTIGWTNVFREYENNNLLIGAGIGGRYFLSEFVNINVGGGGGGFGGNGGNAGSWGAGGGGGYGGKGGNNGGGGGGFGGNGGSSYGGGGGYMSNGADKVGGGGGYYGNAIDMGGGGYGLMPNFAYGGSNAAGNGGICILQYYWR